VRNRVFLVNWMFRVLLYTLIAGPAALIRNQATSVGICLDWNNLGKFFGSGERQTTAHYPLLSSEASPGGFPGIDSKTQETADWTQSLALSGDCPSRLFQGSVYLPLCRESLHILPSLRRPEAMPRETTSSFSFYLPRPCYMALSFPPTRAWANSLYRFHK
jgi:hypothetical protein